MKSEKNKMLDYIKSARSELEQATILFNEMTGSATAVDYASYNLMAAKARYAYLIQIAKEEGVRL